MNLLQKKCVPCEGGAKPFTGGQIAEEEQHHPDITINYNRVRIDLTTHAIKGLSINDFIMAAKIEVLNQ